MVLEKEKQQAGQSRAMGRKEQQQEEQAQQGKQEEEEVVQQQRERGDGGGGAAITPHAYHTGEQTKPPLLPPSLRHPPTYLPTHPLLAW